MISVPVVLPVSFRKPFQGCSLESGFMHAVQAKGGPSANQSESVSIVGAPVTLCAHTDNFSSQEAEARGQPGLHSKILLGRGEESRVLILILTLSLCIIVFLGSPLTLKELSIAHLHYEIITSLTTPQLLWGTNRTIQATSTWQILKPYATINHHLLW